MLQEYHEDGTVTEGKLRWMTMGDLIKEGFCLTSFGTPC